MCVYMQMSAYVRVFMGECVCLCVYVCVYMHMSAHVRVCMGECVWSLLK